MSTYSIFHPWVMSFYSKKLYQDIKQNWKGLGLRYLLLLLAITWIPALYVANKFVAQNVDTHLVPIVNQLPIITIKNGSVSIDQPSPYFIRDNSGNIVVIFDTSGKYADISKTPATILVTQNKVYVKQERNASETRTSTYDISKMNYSVVVDKNMTNSLVAFIKNRAIIYAYPFLILLSFVYRFIEILIYGVFGLLFAAIARVSLSYGSLVRLSAIAVTPAIILATVFTVFNITFPHQGLFYFLLSMAYLFFAVRANKETV